jgi:predicted short-subunit dehydrogenase-like oxidoreductase (DUF2520 family)
MQALSGKEVKPSVSIVGCGTVGTAFGKILSRAGYPISGVATSRAETARAAAEMIGVDRHSDCPWEVTRGGDVVFITTPDDLIGSVCAEIASRRGFEKNAVVIHCSGALSSNVLSSARDGGALAASLHPLQSFATVDQAISLVPDSFCTIEGDAEALPVVRQIVHDVGGILLEIAGDKKTLYHAAAAAASNYLVTLLNLVLNLGEASGMPKDIAFKAIRPLIMGTLKNIDTQGIPDALTGPIARGDVETVSVHLKAIEKEAARFLPLYRCLGHYTVDLALAKKTITQKTADRLLELLEWR